VTVEAIIKAWKKKDYQPVYWLEGEESYYVDQLLDFAENNIISEEERAFNQVVFYGRDAGWSNVVNACMRYPMFGEKQLVLLKEAQHMKDIEKLENYIKNPLSSTIFIVAYKEKKVDGRSKFGKYIKDHTVFYSGAKIRDYELPAWIQGFLDQKGLQPTQKAVMLLADHIGNDLSRLANEVEKLCINLGKRTNLTEEDVETYVGISKDYNVFELQNAVGRKQLDKAMRIVQYFEQNPKAAPIQLVLPSLYGFFSKVYMLFSMNGDDKSIAAATGIHFFVLKEYKQAANIYGYKGVESVLMLLHQYNLKSIGINSTSTSDASLLKELLCKMMM